jgi:TorA maturation chaperone TorD
VAALAALARLLSLGLAYPEAETLAEVAVLARGLAARDGVEPGIRDALAEVAALVEVPGVVEELPAEYGRLFDGRAEIAPYEGNYEADPFRHARQMADVAGFYRAFGAEAHGPSAERADHAGTELEFLAFLAAKRLAAAAAGDAAGAETCRETEDSFLREHAGRWLPTFFRELGRITVSPFYACLAAIGERALDQELALRRLVPEPLGPKRRWSVEADVVECGVEDASQPV